MQAGTLSLIVNDEPRAITAPATVSSLLETLAFDPRKIAVELNREIVPRSLYASTLLRAGDRLEIVHFIGGG